MPGLNAIMDSSLAALFAAQAGLATTGHNIANVNTPGYSRQRVLLAARKPTVLSCGAIGSGVTIEGIRRIQDEFLLNNLRVQHARLADYTGTDTVLAELEAILGSVDSDRLGSALGRFFDGWNALAQPPLDATLKHNVVATAVGLVADFRAVNDALDGLSRQIASRIDAELADLNRMLREVASLNTQIMGAEAGGGHANDLRDQRDQALSAIAQLAEITVLEREDGSKDVILAGHTVVTRDHVSELASAAGPAGSGAQVVVVGGGTGSELALGPGRLQGLLAGRDVQLRDLRARLDAVAAQLIAEVNALHTQGRTANGGGLAFFTGDDMGSIAVNAAILADPDLVATGRTGEAGDNAIALAIADLARAGGDGSGASVTAAYRAALVDVASNRASYQFLAESQANVVTTLEARLASVTGVSLDEEGANMVRYQNSYNAAAKVISTVQEMYDTLLEMV